MTSKKQAKLERRRYQLKMYPKSAYSRSDLEHGMRFRIGSVPSADQYLNIQQQKLAIISAEVSVASNRSKLLLCYLLQSSACSENSPLMRDETFVRWKTESYENWLMRQYQQARQRGHKDNIRTLYRALTKYAADNKPK